MIAYVLESDFWTIWVHHLREAQLCFRIQCNVMVTAQGGCQVNVSGSCLSTQGTGMELVNMDLPLLRHQQCSLTAADCENGVGGALGTVVVHCGFLCGNIRDPHPRMTWNSVVSPFPLLPLGSAHVG